MQNTRYKTKHSSLSISIVVGVLVGVLTFGGIAAAEIYADSAHGNGTYGVDRSTATCGNWPGGVCLTGSCAHCHDTFDPDICQNDVNGLMLFASNDSPGSQTDNFCFQCHKGSGSVQTGGITNNTYSANFGGGTATFTNIYDAFNPPSGVTPSSHNLADVLNHAVDRAIGFTSDVNACLVCHDQHLAQQNYPVVSSGLGGVKTAVRRPADYPSPDIPSNLWGDESGSNELMSDYTARYQAPYYGSPGDPVVGPFEPANDSTADGSNLPNFFNFCSNKCHSRTDVYSTERGENLTQIDWGTGGRHRHGKVHSDGDGDGYTIAPYDDPGESYNYVLSCTDCHESHGSSNSWLLRTCVNGKDNIIVTDDTDSWYEFCTACHVLTKNLLTFHKEPPNAAPACDSCHMHGDPNPNGL
jgi:nitrate reductase cytochrome c-type subunit